MHAAPSFEKSPSFARAQLGYKMREDMGKTQADNGRLVLRKSEYHSMASRLALRLWESDFRYRLSVEMFPVDLGFVT